jgi:hypothetical protein
VLSAEIVTGALVADWFCASVTRRRALYVPGCMYVRVGFTALASSNAPSPSRSHAYVSGPPSGSLEPLPLKLTVNGAGPFVGEPVAEAIGGWLAE